jgi:hypothetical protein
MEGKKNIQKINKQKDRKDRLRKARTDELTEDKNLVN